MTGKPRTAQPRQGVCSECGEKVALVRRMKGDTVIGFHHGNRRGFGAGCSGVAYPPKEKP